MKAENYITKIRRWIMTIEVLRDRRGIKLGEFDGRVTRDSRGVKIGEGNLLTMLLKTD